MIPEITIFAVVLAVMAVPGMVAQDRPDVSMTQQALNEHSVRSCTLVGTLVNGTSGDPVKRAHIWIDRESSIAEPIAETGVNGRFVLSGITRGQHQLAVHKKGYLDGRFTVAACEQERTPRDQSPLAVILRLMPLGVITGRVTDETGDPIADVVVQAKQNIGSSGPLRGARTTTDDLGMYRLHGLEPGRYCISASPEDSASEGPGPSSGESSADKLTALDPQRRDISAATAVSIDAGRTVNGIDIQLENRIDELRASVLPVSATSGSAPNSAIGSGDQSSSPLANSAAGHAEMTGAVVNGATSELIRNAKVTLEPTQNGSGAAYSAKTDATGHFSIKHISPGIYRPIVERAGFGSTPHLSDAPKQIPASITLKPKQALQDVVLRVIPSSVIAGRVFDQDGDPAADFQVRAVRYGYVRGKPQLQIVGIAVTNDLGEYRLPGLSKGKYYISANPATTASEVESAGNLTDRYVATYYPQAIDVEAAAPVAVDEGDQIGGIDIWARLARLLELRGKVSISAEAPQGEIVVTLVRRGVDASEMSFNLTTGVDARGNFEFRDLPPGAYTVSALVNDKTGQYAAAQEIEVRNSSIENLDLHLNRAVAVNGRMKFDSDTPPNLNSVRVTLEPDSNFLAGSLVGDVGADGTFSVSGILPDQYTLEVFGLPEQCYVKRVRLGIYDIEGRKINFRDAAGPLEIVIGTSGGIISGSVVNAEQQSATGVKVVLVPTPPRPGEPALYKTAVSNREGQFKILGIAPGDYELFAVESVESDAFLDPDFVASVMDYAERVTIRENSTIPQVTIKVIPISPAQ